MNPAKFYLLNGLKLKSDIELSNLPEIESTNEIDLKICSSNFEINDKFHTYFVGNDVYINSNSGHKFRVSNGNSIEYIFDTNAPRPLHSSINGLPLGYLMLQKDRFVMHGSSIRFNNIGIGFFGLSSSGKSTLLCKMLEKGFE